MNARKIIFLQRQICLQTSHYNRFNKSEKQLKNVKNQKNVSNDEPNSLLQRKRNNENLSTSSVQNSSNQFKQSGFTSKEFEDLFEDDVETQLNLSTKKNIKKKTKEHEVDRGVLKLIKTVVDELNIQPDEKGITKNQLSNRYKVIQDYLPVESRDFESLLGDIRSSEIAATPVSSGNNQNVDLLDETSPIRIDLTSDDRLGIFEKGEFSEENDLPCSDQSTWSAIDWYKYYKWANYQKFNEMSKRQVALSGYDELIGWTESNKLWKFPINNEDCMPQEASVPFYEHVFFDDKLNEGDWCPKRGPIRDFMNCVINALSLNPFLSVQEKHEHIDWFRDYFVERMETIRNLGLMQDS